MRPLVRRSKLLEALVHTQRGTISHMMFPDEYHKHVYYACLVRGGYVRGFYNPQPAQREGVDGYIQDAWLSALTLKGRAVLEGRRPLVVTDTTYWRFDRNS